jgi:hypothetical protein
VGKSAEELAQEYYDDAWADKHIAPGVDLLPKDTVLTVDRLVKINEAVNAGVSGAIVNLCGVCAYAKPQECASKKFCVDGILNPNYVSKKE